MVFDFNATVYRTASFILELNALLSELLCPVSSFHPQLITLNGKFCALLYNSIFQATSEWTLDYPPLFAWFEWLLSQIASLLVQHGVDPHLLDIRAEPYAPWATLVFQRVTVMVTDIVLLLATWSLVQTIPVSTSFSKAPSSASLPSAPLSSLSWTLQRHHIIVIMLVILNAGLLIVDHIHFQYNGMLLGVLIWMLSLFRQGHDLLAGVMFAILLNMKHLFAYLAPVITIYLWQHYCHINSSFSFRRFLLLGFSVSLIFALSLGPLVFVGGLDQLFQLKNRLFPFGRGLLHAFWAPNLWALYAFADRVLVTLSSRFLAFARVLPLSLPVSLSPESTPSLTRGFVGGDVAQFAILPSIPPGLISALVLLVQLPALISVWKRPHPNQLHSALVHCTMAGFLLGWHVHEKAAIVHVLLLAFTSFQSELDSRVFRLSSAMCHITLLPLLFEPDELTVKLLLAAAYFLFSQVLLHRADLSDEPTSASAKIERVCISLVAPVVVILSELLLPWLLPQLPFLPLMLLSVFGALGNLYAFVLSYNVLQSLHVKLK